MDDKLFYESLEHDNLNLDILENTLEVDPMMIFPEWVNIDEEIMTEAFGVKKKNILQRIGGIIKKCWKWIVKQCRAIVNGIKKFFGAKDAPKKSVDQIASTVLNISIATAGIGAATALGQQKLGPLTDNTLNDIASDVEKGDLKSAGSKCLRLEYDDGRTITFNVLANMIKQMVSIKGPTHGERFMEGLAIVFHSIKNPGALDPMINTLKQIKENNGNIDAKLKDIDKQVNDFIKTTVLGARYTITLSEWINFNEKCTEFGELLAETWDKLDLVITQNGEALTERWIATFNKFAAASTAMNAGLNVISDSMKQSYVLDPVYHDKIKDIEKLDDFILSCIKSNIPGKYILANTKLICDISLCSKRTDPKTKDNDLGQLSGHGRYPLFPQDQSKCIKIGYNMYGIRSNLIEKQIFDEVKKWPEVASELCGIQESSRNNVVLVMDRAVPKKVSTAQAKMTQNKLNTALEKNGSKFRIVDVNYKGFGEVKGKMVVLDYGQVRRTAGAKKGKENVPATASEENEAKEA